MNKVLDINEFQNLVYQLARLVPYGRATSYGAIAKAIGYPNHSRLVGSSMGKCPADVPAYRVVNSQGVLSGRESFDGSHRMQKLLETEGIVVEKNRIKNWENIFWNPIHELDK